MEIKKEALKSDFKGTIIDLETFGEFDRIYNDSRQFRMHIPIILGFIDKNGLNIYCAKTKNSLEKLRKHMDSLLLQLEKPFYAFNSLFERGVLFHYLNKIIPFEKELNKEKFEAKRNAVRELSIPNYEDPFFDNGYQCTLAWLRGDIREAILHNRACLLKERDILLKRGCREPDELRFMN